MNKIKYGVVTFHSTSHAIQAERVCKHCKLEIKLIPVPRHLSSDCGVCLRFSSADWDEVEKLMKETNVEISQMVMLD